MGGTSLRFAPDRGPAVFRNLLGWPRTTGGWERSIARQYRGRSGIVFGFRGARHGNGKPIPTLPWTFFEIEIDGVTVTRHPADSGIGGNTTMSHNLRPKWLSMRPGHVDIVVRSDLGGEGIIARLALDIPAKEPVVVALVPETKQFGSTRPALIWSYRLGKRDGSLSSDARSNL